MRTDTTRETGRGLASDLHEHCDAAGGVCVCDGEAFFVSVRENDL